MRPARSAIQGLSTPSSVSAALLPFDQAGQSAGLLLLQPLEGADAAAISVPPAPAFASACGWRPRCRRELLVCLDTRCGVQSYAVDPTTAQAVADLNKLSDFRGTKANGQVTTDVIFRSNTPGDLADPYISQFLWKTVPMGGRNFTQQYRTSVAGNDYMTNHADWLKVLKGATNGTNVFDSAPRYIRNNRDMAQFLFVDFMGQANINAFFLLVDLRSSRTLTRQPRPQLDSRRHRASTFGPPGILDLVSRAPDTALRASFYQKWLVHP